MKQIQLGNRRFSGHRGFTLVEMLIIIAIVGVVVGGIAAGVTRGLAKQRANDESSELQEVVTNIQGAYSNKSNYAGVTAAQLITLSVFPEARVSGTTVSNRWSGAVTVAAATCSIANDCAAMTSTAVPDTECKGVVQKVDGVMRIITVNGTSVKALGGQLDLTALGTACANGANTIVYTFSK